MSNDRGQPADEALTTPPALDARLVQWLAVQVVQDARARLVEGRWRRRPPSSPVA